MPVSAFTRGKMLASLVYPEFFPVDSSHRVLDLACGTGPQIALFSRGAREVVGIDIQEHRLTMATALIAELRLTNARVIRADVSALPLKHRSADRAIAIDIIEHLDDPDAFLRDVGRVLVPGGRLLVTVPALYDRLKHGRLGSLASRLKGRGAYFSGGLGYDDHRPPRPLRDWQELFEKCGFRVRRTRATTLFPPLHRYGVPRFWFAISGLRRTLSALGSIGPLKGLGQGVMFDLEVV